MSAAFVGLATPEDIARYEPVIGLEVHVQVATATKIFCSCPTSFGAQPHSNVCPVCLGLTGTLPVLSRQAVDLAIRAALALSCSIRPMSRFARKNYFYPDLPKGYQISQYDQPLAEHGHVDISVDGVKKRIGVMRVHMEDDAGKSIHDGFADSSRYSYADLNRCGTPLIEIVSEPDLRSSDEAVGMRSKEHAHDYRYFLEPDLVPLHVSERWLEEVRSQMPELPAQKRTRFVEAYGLRDYDAQALTQTRALGEYYETVAKVSGDPRAAANWVMGDLSGALNEAGKDIAESPVTAAHLGELVAQIRSNVISGKLAKETCPKVLFSGEAARAHMERDGLTQTRATVAL